MNKEPYKIKKFVQIIELKRKIYAVYQIENEQEFKNSILFAGLTQEGQILLLDLPPDGFFDDATENSNFLRYEYEEN